jgi:8-oxo-dGTP pyrophosphatase MutT (NUDIX family)
MAFRRDVLATADYGEVFSHAGGHGNVLGAQFHRRNRRRRAGAARCLRAVGTMSSAISLVDVLVLRPADAGLSAWCSGAPGGVRPDHGKWFTGTLIRESHPGAALRELEEETGLVPVRMYNLSRWRASTCTRAMP